METIRKELVEQTAKEVWQYVLDTNGADIDIEEVTQIVDMNIGFAVDAAYEV